MRKKCKTKDSFILEHYEDVTNTLLGMAKEFLFAKSGVDIGHLLLDQEWHSLNGYDGYNGIYRENKHPYVSVTYHSFKGGETDKFLSSEAIGQLYNLYSKGKPWKSADVMWDHKPLDETHKKLKDQERHYARVAAMNEWAVMFDDFVEHPYLKRKGLLWKSYLKHGIDNYGFFLAAKIEKIATREAVGWQKIYPIGFKKFNTGLSKKGSAIMISGDTRTAYLAEGLADAMTISQCTRASTCAFLDIGNLASVVEAFEDDVELVIVADNDKERLSSNKETKENIGVLTAKAVADKRPKTSVIIPDILREPKVDVNDYYLKYGEQGVKRLLGF